MKNRVRTSAMRIFVRSLATVVAVAAGVLLTGASASAAAPPLPPDTNATSTPTIDSSGLFIVSRGLDGSVLYSQGSPFDKTYAPFVSLDGPIIGDPSGVISPDGAQVFARDTSNQAITTLVVLGPVQPRSFAVIPGLLISSEVAAVAIPPRGSQPPQVRIFARGLEDGSVYTNLLIQGAPQGWVNLGGFITSEISAAVTGPLDFTVNIRVTARGGDSRLHAMVFNNTNGVVSPWAPVGDLVVAGNPTLSRTNVTSFPDSQLRGNEVFVRAASNGALFTWNFDSPGWVNLGGVVNGDIAVSVASDGGLHVHVRGTTRNVYLNRRPPGSTRFGGYVNLGGIGTGSPAAAGGGRRTSDGQFVDQFIVRGTDNRMYSRIQVNLIGGFTSYFAFGGPPHG